MIYFKSLNGKAVRYRNKINVKKVYDHVDPEWFKKYYPDENVCVAVCVCIGKRPIWSVGSYAERWNTFVPDNYDKLPISEQRKIFDDYNELTGDELHLLEHLVRTVVVPVINSICHDNDNSEDQIIDIRNMFATECHNMGYIIAKTANTNNDL